MEIINRECKCWSDSLLLLSDVESHAINLGHYTELTDLSHLTTEQPHICLFHKEENIKPFISHTLCSLSVLSVVSILVLLSQTFPCTCTCRVAMQAKITNWMLKFNQWRQRIVSLEFPCQTSVKHQQPWGIFSPTAKQASPKDATPGDATRSYDNER